MSLLTGGYELIKLTSLPMCGFIAQLVEHRTGIAEVTGSNPVEALIFFQASSFQLLKLENSLRGSFFTFGNIHDGMVTNISSFDKVKMAPKKKARVDPDSTEANGYRDIIQHIVPPGTCSTWPNPKPSRSSILPPTSSVKKCG